MTHDLTEFGAIIASVAEQTEEQREATVRLRLRLIFVDGSVLHVRENRVRKTSWLDYAYQWQTANHRLLVRWDNAHEYPGIPTSPFHQHVGSEDDVQPSEPMTLESVLRFIASQLTAD